MMNVMIAVSLELDKKKIMWREKLAGVEAVERGGMGV
jgi:hypothetical protein